MAPPRYRARGPGGSKATAETPAGGTRAGDSRSLRFARKVDQHAAKRTGVDQKPRRWNKSEHADECVPRKKDDGVQRDTDADCGGSRGTYSHNRRAGSRPGFNSTSLNAEVHMLEAKFEKDLAISSRKLKLEEEEILLNEGVAVGLQELKQGEVTLHDAQFAISCLNTLEKLGSSDRMSPTVAQLFLLLSQTLREALYQANDAPSGATQHTDFGVRDLEGQLRSHSLHVERERFYCLERDILKDEIRDKSRAGDSLQAKVGVLRNQYIAMVEKFRDLEDKLDGDLGIHHNASQTVEHCTKRVELLRKQVDDEVRRQDSLQEMIETVSKAFYKQSQELYESNTRKKNLRLDIKGAHEKLESFRAELDGSDNTVPASKLRETMDQVDEAKAKIFSEEASLKELQQQYAELLAVIKKQETKLEHVRSTYQAKSKEEQDIERSLTPRPDLDYAASVCVDLDLRKDDNDADNKAGEKQEKPHFPTTAEIGSSTGVDPQPPNTPKRNMHGQRSRRGSVTTANLPTQKSPDLAVAVQTRGQGAPMKRGKTRRALLNRKKTKSELVPKAATPGTAKQKQPQPDETKEANYLPTGVVASRVAQFIEEHKLDGHKLLRLQETLVEQQAKLRSVRDQLQLAENFSSPGMVHTMLSGTSDDTSEVWYNRHFKYETGKKGEVLVYTLGKAPSVPMFLRADGKFAVRLIPKQELLELVNDVWNLKFSKEQAVGSSEVEHMPLTEALYQILKNRYGLQTVVAKWGYNVLYSLQELLFVADFELFFLALTQRLPEGAYVDQQAMVKSLGQFMKKLSSIESGGVLGELSKAVLFTNLEQFFPTKDDDDHDELQEVVNEEQPISVVFVHLLLDEASSGFLPTVKAQHLEEIKGIYRELEEGMNVAASMYKDHERCKLSDVVQVLRKVDEHLDNDGIDRFLLAGFPDQLSTAKDAAYVRKFGRFPRTGSDGQDRAGHESVEEDAQVVIEDFMAEMKKICFKPQLNFDPEATPVLSND